jgi:hypothetical protein
MVLGKQYLLQRRQLKAKITTLIVVFMGIFYPYMVNTVLNNASLVQILSIRVFCTFDTL